MSSKLILKLVLSGGSEFKLEKSSFEAFLASLMRLQAREDAFGNVLCEAPPSRPGHRSPRVERRESCPAAMTWLESLSLGLHEVVLI